MRARELGASLRAKVQENEAMKRYLDSVKVSASVVLVRCIKRQLFLSVRWVIFTVAFMKDDSISFLCVINAIYWIHDHYEQTSFFCCYFDIKHS